MTTVRDDLAGLDGPVRSLFERIAGPAAAAPDLPAVGAALVELAGDLAYIGRWVTALGEASGGLAIHAPERGPRLLIVHRGEDQMGAVHDHATWPITPIVGLETHRRYRPAGDGSDPSRVEVVEALALRPSDVATLLPPDDIHDHGHLAGQGEPAYVLVMTGDDQVLFARNEWDPVSGRHRVLEPGDRGRGLASQPWPSP